MGIDLWASALAEGRSSRLVKHLREELQLVESIDVEVHPLERGSLVILEAVTDLEHLSKVRLELQKLLKEAQEGLGKLELERSKRMVANGYTFGLEAISQVTHHLGQASLQRRLCALDQPLRWLEEWDLTRLQALSGRWDLQSACLLEVIPA
jgi:predicted Zn-dependent peptidase